MIPPSDTLIIVIIIAFKGAIGDFLQSPHSAANCLQHVRSSGTGAIVCKSRATRRALITCKCMLRATWYEGTARLLSLTELKSHLFELCSEPNTLPTSYSAPPPPNPPKHTTNQLFRPPNTLPKSYPPPPNTLPTSYSVPLPQHTTNQLFPPPPPIMRKTAH